MFDISVLVPYANQLHDLVDANMHDDNSADALRTQHLLIHSLAHKHCRSLTLALHEKTGLPVYILYDENGGLVHSYLRFDEYALDGYLLSSPERTVARYQLVADVHGLGSLSVAPISAQRLRELNKRILRPASEMLIQFRALIDLSGIEVVTPNLSPLESHQLEGYACSLLN